MSRITGSDAASLMEAYNAVYAPRELTEEQVWQEVENWVNSLVEEGYDLSEYTWEDMYEAYLTEIDADEMGTPSLASRNAASQRENEAKLKRLRAQRDLSGRPPVANLPSNLKSTEQGATAAGMRVAGKTADIRGSQTPGSQTPKTTSTTSSTPRPASQVVLAKKGGVEGRLDKATGKFTAGNFSDAERARYGNKPAAPAPAAGGDTKPTTPTGATVADKKTAVPTKTQNPLMKDNSVSDMIKASQMRQKGANVTSDNIASVRQSVQQANRPEVQNRPAPAGSALRAQQDAAKPGAAPVAAKPAPTPAAKPAPVAAKPAPVAAKPAPVAAKPEKRTPTQIRQGINAGVDLFDIVKGHLLDEGYADTEEAALAIMANMSEEWKQTILEADSVAKMAERAAKRRQQRYGKQGGGGRDDYRPYTPDDYKNPKPGYGSSQVKPA